MARFLVCTSCRAALVELGAVPVLGMREGSQLDRCAVHPSSLEVHAMNVLEADPEVVSRWTAAQREALPSPPPHVLAASDLVATIAARLLAGVNGTGTASTPVDVAQAITVARQVVSAVKGEAVP